MSTTPSRRSAPTSPFISRVDPSISLRDPQSFPPIYKNLPPITARDPFGLLPLRRRIQATKTCVLEWDNHGKCLKPWLWPAEHGQRVPPSGLGPYRQTHNFHYPYCLCSVHELDSNHSTESAVFLVTKGPLAGEYVAACAQVLLERMYPKRSQPVSVYPLRASTVPAPAEVFYEGDDNVSSSSTSTPSEFEVYFSAASGSSSVVPLRRAREDSADDLTPICPVRRRLYGSGSSATAAGSSSPINPFIVPYVTPEPLPIAISPFAMLMQLDASSNPGLTEAQFRKLFVRCSSCKLFTTISAFEDHNCRPTSTLSTEIIDLTSED
ncbi:hypothetical protein DFH09DRAFT_1488997 [Mycena vulgaris]|nr:hypothetical protein DFH09DRAFT_1488997 [Mycena vulgaris]